MIEHVNTGDTVKIRVFLWNGSAALAGKTVNVSIERLSDGAFYDGDYDPGTYAAPEMTELTGNAHKEGVYEYSFVTQATEDVYDWVVKYEEGDFLTYFRGRIVAKQSPSAALTAYDGPTKAELDSGLAGLNDLTAAQVNAECDTAISDAALATATNLATVDTVVDSILEDTATTIPATLATIEGKIDTADGVVDTILTRTLSTTAAAALEDAFDGTGGVTMKSDITGTVSGNSTHNAAAVWAAGTRTLSSFGTLVADIATAVWAAVTRTVTGGAIDACTSNADMRGTDSASTHTAANVRTEMDSNSTQLTDIKAKTDVAEDNIRGTDDDTLKTISEQLDGIPTSVNVTLGAIQASNDPGNRNASPIPLEMFQAEEKAFALTVLDAEDSPVDLSGMTLRFVAMTTADPAAGVFKVEAPSVVVSGDDDEVATVTVSTTQSATARTDLYWLLWNVDDDEVLAHGSFKIRPAVEDV